MFYFKQIDECCIKCIAFLKGDQVFVFFSLQVFLIVCVCVCDEQNKHKSLN